VAGCALLLVRNPTPLAAAFVAVLLGVTGAVLFLRDRRPANVAIPVVATPGTPSSQLAAAAPAGLLWQGQGTAMPGNYMNPLRYLSPETYTSKRRGTFSIVPGAIVVDSSKGQLVFRSRAGIQSTGVRSWIVVVDERGKPWSLLLGMTNTERGLEEALVHAGLL
jgi:hypothetical protein